MTRDLSSFDVVVKVCDFTTPSKSANKVIDGPYMTQNVVQNPKWKTKLRDGQVMGLFSHKGRQPVEHMDKIPYEDNIAISPYLCNVARDVWVDGNDLYAGLEIFGDKEYGKLVRDMLMRGLNVPVSMAVKAQATHDRYYVKDLLGIDFTFKPDLAAEITQVNFSEVGDEDLVYHFSYIPDEVYCNEKLLKRYSFDITEESDDQEIFIKPGQLDQLDKLGIDYIKDNMLTNGYLRITIKNPSLSAEQQKFVESVDSNFDSCGGGLSAKPAGTSINNIGAPAPVKAKEVLTLSENSDFSDLASFIEDHNTFNFSLQHYLQELKLAPFQVLRKRINEIVRMVNSKNQEWTTENSGTLKAYLDTYVLKWVQDILNNPDEKFNLMMGLRLASYRIDRTLLTNLQKALNRTKTSISNTSIMTPALQKQVNHSYQAVMQGLYRYINEECAKSGNVLKT